jgi:hypothetical protein
MPSTRLRPSVWDMVRRRALQVLDLLRAVVDLLLLVGKLFH